jgi:hypothetical protein
VSSGTAPAPVPLRPLAPTELLDRAFAVLKGAPGTLLAFAAIFVVPVQFVAGWLQRDLLDGGMFEVFTDPELTQSSADEANADALASILVLLGSSISLPFVAVGIALFLAARHAGRDPSLGELLRGTLRRTPTVLVAWTLIHVAELIGAIACLFPGLLVMALFMVTAPVVAVEGLGPIAAMRRSAQLTRRRFWPTLGIGLLSGIVAGLFDQALSTLPDVLAFAVGDRAGWVLLSVGGGMSAIITTPVITAATTLHYLDLRVRTEGLDLEVDLPAAFPTA